MCSQTVQEKRPQHALRQPDIQLHKRSSHTLQHKVDAGLFTCLCRLTNGASLSRQDQAELQRSKSSLLQLPSRKRSRSTLGLDRGAERDTSPSTSTAARSQDRAFRRTTSAHEGGATSKPDKPARCARIPCKACISSSL